MRLPQPLRFVALLLAALGLVPGGAHLLELPVKLGYEPALYAQVTSTLYRLFGSVGAFIQVLALILAAALSWRARGDPSFLLTALGAAALALSLVLWGAPVAPVNAAWTRVIETAPSSVPEVYAQLRPRWEYGHVAAVAAWLAGFILLLASSLADPKAKEHV